MTAIKVAGSCVIEWPELKAAFLRGYEGGEFSKQRRIGHKNGWRKGQHESWNGCSADDMANYLRNGFESPEFPVGDNYVPHAEQRRMTFGEEGELDLTLAWSGHDYPYLSWETRKMKPGIRMVCEFGFSGAISDKLIAKYGAWIMGILEGLSTRGYDIELDVRFTTHGQNSSVGRKQSGGPSFSTIIRLKRENELTDLTDFSAIFSPGGYRILMFLATELAADKVNARVDSAIGRCIRRKTSIDYDAETNTLDIWADQMSSNYDFDRMTQQVEEALEG